MIGRHGRRKAVTEAKRVVRGDRLSRGSGVVGIESPGVGWLVSATTRRDEEEVNGEATLGKKSPRG